jgi:hypothetical protein
MVASARDPSFSVSCYRQRSVGVIAIAGPACTEIAPQRSVGRAVVSDLEDVRALYRIFVLSRLSLPTALRFTVIRQKKAGLSGPGTLMNRPSDAIPVLPEDLDSGAVDLDAAASQADALPEHLALPLLWSQYHNPAVVLTTTVDKLFSVTVNKTLVPRMDYLRRVLKYWGPKV